MRILVVGAGLTGCSIARLMKNKGHTVSMIEKEPHIGGLCYTETSSNGIMYEPYGGHAFHTKDSRVRDLVLEFSEFNDYRHNKGIIINGKLLHFPLSKESILKMEDSHQIIKDLENKPKKPDLTNFETYAISQFGVTLYKLFIYNYSKKMWGLEPKELTTEYIKNRIELKNTNTHIFKDKFQGLPVKGYTVLLHNMIHDIPLELNTSEFDDSIYDLILFSGRIDELLKLNFGKLEFRSLLYHNVENEYWENENYGTINLPQDPNYIRKVNFKVMHQQKINESLIQYQEPVQANGQHPPLYPIYTKRNLKLFNQYLVEACKSENFVPIGRLGLYKYLEMGQAISLVMNMIPLIEKWKILTPEARYHGIKNLLTN
ncbi:MAG: UDP-galactopyranose mutase [Promethearchaeota archaeon]